MKKFNLFYLLLFVAVTFSSSATAQDGNKEKVSQKQINLQVDGLSCPFCAYGLEKKLKAIDGVQKTDIKLNSGQVNLYVRPAAKIDSLTLKKKISEAGFTLKSYEKVDNNNTKTKK